jgi:AraC-like DNA-binding protein
MSRRRFLPAPIVAAMHAVSDALERPWPLPEMAAQAGLSSYHFHRLFRGALAETPASFVERLRLERAALLLLVADAPITELAWDVGFRNPETFARRFRARFGVAARDYRRCQLELFSRLGLGVGEDPGGPGAIELRHLPRMTFGIRCSIGEDEGFVFDPDAEPWRDWSIGTGIERIGITLDFPGITPPGRVRQEWGIRMQVDDGCGERIPRIVGDGLYATLAVSGHGPVPPTVYQRLFVRTMAGRYRVRPGGILELHRGDRVMVHQPVSDTKEVWSDVRVRASDRQAGSRGL